jgi:hypothetical protein
MAYGHPCGNAGPVGGDDAVSPNGRESCNQMQHQTGGCFRDAAKAPPNEAISATKCNIKAGVFQSCRPVRSECACGGRNGSMSGKNIAGFVGKVSIVPRCGLSIATMSAPSADTAKIENCPADNLSGSPLCIQIYGPMLSCLTKERLPVGMLAFGEDEVGSEV